jgi:nitrate reductase beta subunit
MLYLSKKNVAKVYRILYIFKFFDLFVVNGSNFLKVDVFFQSKNTYFYDFGFRNGIPQPYPNIPKSEIHNPKSPDLHVSIEKTTFAVLNLKNHAEYTLCACLFR